MIETTEAARKVLRTSITKVELSKGLGISRPTLDKKLSGKAPWKVLEELYVEKLYRRIKT